MGDLELAKKMIKYAVQSGASIVKFQKRDIDEWALKKYDVYHKPHPDSKNSFGSTYEEHRRFLELDFEQHKILKEYCDSLGGNYSASVWDIKSAIEICSLNPKMIKIASACNQKFELLEWLCENYFGEIHISFGMTSLIEIEEIISFFEKKGRNKDLIIYSCTSGYPVPAKDICLLEISKLKERYYGRVKSIGFSGHHSGTIVDLAAYTLGAEYIERHFTLDRDFKGTDQKASILPEELKQLIQNLDELSLALNYKNKNILDIEKNNKEKLKW